MKGFPKIYMCNIINNLIMLLLQKFVIFYFLLQNIKKFKFLFRNNSTNCRFIPIIIEKISKNTIYQIACKTTK